MRSDFTGWLPYQLRPSPEEADCRWLYVGETRFTDPFFADTIGRCLSLPENSFEPPRLTQLDALSEIARGVEGIEPSAFIFHVSRCGSTLVSQLLSLHENCVALSEVSFFDQLLRARHDSRVVPEVNLATHFPAAMRLYGQRRSPREHFLVVKLDSWHVGFYTELRSLYPRVPFILLYREPAAVLRSQRQRPGMHAVRGVIEDSVFGFLPDRASPPEAHLPRVLAFYYERFLEIARADKRMLLVPYQPDMIPAVQSIARFCGIEISPAQTGRMRARAAFHSKDLERKFQETPLGSATEEAWPDCSERYRLLEEFRCATTR